MALELRLTPRAEQDLEEIWDYTEAEWSEHQALRYLGTLETVMMRLCEEPLIARERGEVDPPVRLYTSGAHVVLYRADGRFLDVLRILGARQDWAALLTRLD
ncbi:MAG: type II toxin-antitoxin system RelE/ParE family toxin [Pseudomonadota bacterium]|nr:type II toxin-antitoxin system RelE/ParE family toxin [Pseudomonadota bacterium]